MRTMGDAPACDAIGNGAAGAVGEADDAVVPRVPHGAERPLEEVVRPRVRQALVEARVLNARDLEDVVGRSPDAVGPAANASQRCWEPARLLGPRRVEAVHDPRLPIEGLREGIVIDAGNVLQSGDVVDPRRIDEGLEETRNL